MHHALLAMVKSASSSHHRPALNPASVFGDCQQKAPASRDGMLFLCFYTSEKEMK